MNRNPSYLRRGGWVCLLLGSLLLAGCLATSSARNATSVVDYLYPNVREPVVSPGIPVLTLPTRVAIAFVPGETSKSVSGRTPFRPSQGFMLTETKKIAVLQEVADHFKKVSFVGNIEIIPSAYLTPRGSFANLDQVRTMYGVDVIVLVSYDQTQFTDEGMLSLAYWTIVGAYVVQGQKNDTHTMLDAVVYDIASRKMLFRAPGTSMVKGSATLVNLSEQLRVDSEAGFNKATAAMIANLDTQLVAFQEKVKQRPEEYRVVQTSSGSSRGGGMLDLLTLALLAVLGGGYLWLRRRG